MTATMERFLEETKNAVEKLNVDSSQSVHIVMGNEACDLDSAISALVYAFYLYKTSALTNTLVIPILNIRRTDFSLHTEVTFFLKESNIPSELLSFRDDVDLQSLHRSERLSVTLVDHNQLPVCDQNIQDSITEIIDHHKLEPGSDNRKCQIILESVGSCSSLVAEKLLNDERYVMEHEIAFLLYGTILLDTICLNEVAKRVTPKDRNVAEKLAALLPDVDRESLFQSLHKAKFDVSDLNMNELLLKDLKVISNNTMSLAVASICSSLEDLLQRPDAETELQKFASSNNYQIVVLMGLQVNSLTQEATRQLAVFSSSQGYREQIVDLLEAVSNRGPKLKLQSLASPYSTVVLYRQNNVAASRKVVLPLLKLFLLGDRSPSISGDTCSGVSSNTNSMDCCKNEPSTNNGVANDEHLVNYDPLAAESEDVFVLNEAIGNSISHLHVLGIGDPISHAGSSQSSSNQNSCPYTPQNSCTDGGLELDPYARQILPSFNSREMMEKIESKRGKLRGYEGGECDAADNTFYPFTPKNSFVDGSFEAYIKNVPSFDSGEFLLKVNEKVASLDSAATCDQMAGSITVEVPQVVDRNIKNVQLGSSTNSQDASSVEDNHANTKEEQGSQQCPEGVSLSDKLDKSDEKMDTSETSGSNSNKTSPLPNDLELQTTTTTTAIATNTKTSTIAANHNNLIQKTCENGETSPAPQLRTDSSASISSIQTDVDLELAANYQTETVDFPDSPRQLKFLTQSSLDMQGLSLEDTVPEEDEDTEQPDDDVFRAVLSPSSDGVVLKKDIFKDSPHNESVAVEDLLLSTEIESDADFENSIVVLSSTDDDDYELESKVRFGINAKSVSCESKNETGNIDDSFRLLENYQAFANWFSTPKHTEEIGDMHIRMLSPLEDGGREGGPSRRIFAEMDTILDSITSNCVNLEIVKKLLPCFEQKKVTDVYVMSRKFQDILEPHELEEILNNSQLYVEYLGRDVLEALHHIQTGIYDIFPENHTIEHDTKLGYEANKKSIITLDKTCLDQSIVDHFNDELQLTAVFESSKVLRRTLSSCTENKTEIELQSSNLYVKQHGQGASFVESRSERRRSKQLIPVTFKLSLNDTLSSPEADHYIEEETKYYSLTDLSCSPPERPTTLNATGKKKRKIKVNHDILNTSEEKDDEKSLSSLSNKSDGDILSPVDDMATPDDIDTPDELDDSVTDVTDPIPEVSAAEERDEERRWRTCVIGGVQRKIDLKVIEPYKKVLSHGGYYGPKRSAIIVFSACYLPDHSRKDYDYVMDNLFLYVLTTLDQLVAEDYVLVYLHGAIERNNMPTFGWLKRCYQMIDRRLRKNLKGLYLVHPTFWLKTLVVMTKPFISSKFARKLQFVNTLGELSELVPIDQMSIPDKVKQIEFELMIKEKKRKHKQQRTTSNRSDSSSQEVESSNTTDISNGTKEDQIYRKFHAENLALSNGWV